MLEPVTQNDLFLSENLCILLDPKVVLFFDIENSVYPVTSKYGFDFFIQKILYILLNKGVIQCQKFT